MLRAAISVTYSAHRHAARGERVEPRTAPRSEEIALRQACPEPRRRACPGSAFVLRRARDELGTNGETASSQDTPRTRAAHLKAPVVRYSPDRAVLINRNRRRDSTRNGR